MSVPAKRAVSPANVGKHREGLVGITIRDFPRGLKRRLAKAAEAEGTNVQDLVVTTLAAAYAVKYVPNGRRSSGVGDSSQMYFEMPRPLRRKINQQAAKIEQPARSIILHLLSERFDKK